MEQIFTISFRIKCTENKNFKNASPESNQEEMSDNPNQEAFYKK